MSGPVQLTTKEATLFADFDSRLDTLFLNGAQDQNGLQLLPPLRGYQEASNVPSQSPSNLQPLIRNSVEPVVMAVLRSLRLLADDFTLPTLLSGWSSHGAGWSVPGHLLDPLGWVQLKGVYTNSNGVGAANPMFRLPEKMRPNDTLIFRVLSANAPLNYVEGEFRVGPDGTCFMNNGGSGSGNFTSLDGVRFKAFQ
jgi:hypothetical protein